VYHNLPSALREDYAAFGRTNRKSDDLLPSNPFFARNEAIRQIIARTHTGKYHFLMHKTMPLLMHYSEKITGEDVFLYGNMHYLCRDF
jgi:hypothetical protein